jgi:hypothetical protein
LLPTLTRSYPCRFTFYVADPISLSAMSVALVLGLVYLISELLLTYSTSKAGSDAPLATVFASGAIA